jgi:hypothetical protein
MKHIAAALVKAQKEFGPALKTSNNPHFRSKYADLSACIEAVIDGLNNNGIYLMQLNEERDGGVCVQTVFIHESGEQITSGSLFVPAAKQDPQGYGSALTYARRYSLMAACGIAPEDNDANFVKAPAPRPAVVPAAKPAPNPTPAPKPEAAPVVPPKMEGKDSQWQLKVSAEPGTEWEDWLKTVVDLTVFALEAAQSREDVMTIFRTNRVIYDRIQAQDAGAYTELTATFKHFKEQFNEQVSE